MRSNLASKARIVPQPPDQHLWNIVKRRCVPLGQPVYGDPVVSRLVAVQPTRRLDLHNLTVADAYTATRAFIADAKAAGVRDIEIITGRSGQIRSEFERWAVLDDEVRGFEVLASDGAFRVRI